MTYYSKAMVDTVRAWAEHRKKTVTLYKTDGHLFWFKGTLLGFTMKDGTKVYLSNFPHHTWGTIDYKTRKTVREYSDLELGLPGPDDDEAKWHAIWSMLERSGVCPQSGQMRFHYITKLPPMVSKVVHTGVKTAKPYKYRISKVVHYCPHCVTEGGIKQHVWGKVVLTYDPGSKHIKCGKPVSKMTTSGAKIFWEIIKEDTYAVLGKETHDFVKDAIQKGK